MTETVAALVRRLRNERGRGGKRLNQEDLAQLAGVSRDTIIEIEKGESEHGFSTITSVLLALGVEIYNLKTGEQVKPDALPKLSEKAQRLVELFEALGDQAKDAVSGIVRQMTPEGETRSRTTPPPAPRRRGRGRR